jgi:hypothetical protein
VSIGDYILFTPLADSGNDLILVFLVFSSGS